MPSPAIPKWLAPQLTAREYVAKYQLTTCGYSNWQLTECGYGNWQLTTYGYGNWQLTECGYGNRQLAECGYGNRHLTECGYSPQRQLTRCEYEADIGRGQTNSESPSPLRMRSVEAHPEILKAGCKDGCITLGCFTNGTIIQVVTNSLSPLRGQHLYDGSGATV